MAIFKKEREMTPRLEEHLKKMGCWTLRERYGACSWMDLTAKLPDGEFVAFELKLHKLSEVMHQAENNLAVCHYSFVVVPDYRMLVPSAAPEKALRDCVKLGIGLITMNPETSKLVCMARARRLNEPYSQHTARLERVFLRNRKLATMGLYPDANHSLFKAHFVF